MEIGSLGVGVCIGLVLMACLAWMNWVNSKINK
jgi:hypothetical protein